jgi:hypothetical protein
VAQGDGDVLVRAGGVEVGDGEVAAAATAWSMFSSRVFSAAGQSQDP